MGMINLKYEYLVMGIMLTLILLCGSLLAFSNRNFNNKEHTASLKNGYLETQEATFKLQPRGYEEGEIASWVSYLPVPDPNTGSNAIVGTIYEMTVTNNTDTIIKDWHYTISLGENALFNDGWNGDFEITQNKNTSQPLTDTISFMNKANFSTSLVNNGDSSVVMIPLIVGDTFTYYPDESANEKPIAASDLKKKEYSNKTTGFILYFYNPDKNYITEFPSVTVTYKMYSSLFRNKLFIFICIAFVIWVIGFLEITAVNLTTKKLRNQRNRSLMMIDESMKTFINFIDAKDPNTRGHSVRVAEYSKMIAHKAGLSDDECTDVYYIALMHDCGKISIPQEILTKPGKLTDEEYAVMKSHPQKGYDMLKSFKTINNIGLGAYCHHERYDGKGYPKGLKGEEIPLIGRIIGVADAFDAMNSKRCYRDKLPKDVIMKELIENKGKQFDPGLLDIMIDLINKGDIKID